MINLNTLARRVIERYLQCRLMTAHTSEKARVLRISSSWRRLFNANDYPAKEMPEHTSKEVSAADIILDTVEYLKSIGCTDIEKLLRDRLDNLEEE